MNVIYYIGLDIHKKTIAYCIKRVDGELVRQGTVAAGRNALKKWLSELPGPRSLTLWLTQCLYYQHVSL